MKQDRIPPIPRSFELRVERTLAQIPEMEEKMKRRHSFTLVLAAVLLLAITTTALAVSGGSVMKLFGRDTRPSELTDKLSGAVQPFGGEYTGESVRVTPGEALLAGDVVAAAWTVENIGDELLWIDGPLSWTLNGEPLPAEHSDSDLHDIEYYIEPGEIIECGLRTNLSGGAPEGESTLELSFSAYRSKSGERRMLNENGVVQDENRDDLEPVETLSFTAPLIRAEVEMKSALPDGEPLTFKFDDYSLIVERAQLSPSLLTLKYRRVYPDAEAVQRSPLADYSVTDLSGSDAWWYAAAGSASPDLLQAEDGTYYFETEMEYDVTDWPDGIILRPGYANDDAKSEAESIVLRF